MLNIYICVRLCAHACVRACVCVRQVTRHGLEYPAFYKRLYGLLVAEAFAARHRAQFFRLVDIFLASTLVPAYTVAAFVKRFARLALVAPPAGALVAIGFIHNLIRRWGWLWLSVRAHACVRGHVCVCVCPVHSRPDSPQRPLPAAPRSYRTPQHHRPSPLCMARRTCMHASPAQL